MLPTSPTEKQPKAYSYIRFSTPEQAKGDSLRRQTEAARRWAKERGVELDESTTFKDLGKSAYHGRNLETGQLGVFLGGVREGLIPAGSYLVVESLDRISRQTVRKAARTMEDIVEAGVNLVDLEDGGRVYSAESLDDPTAFLIMAVRLMRGNAESKMKSVRLAGAYENKRREAASGKPQTQPFTRMLPAWLRWNDEFHRYEAIPDRAEIVRTIFRMADAGEGQHKIAHWLNETGVETWGKGSRQAAYWHRSYVRKILTNRAVVGTFTPHTAVKEAGGRRIRKPQDSVEGYLPTVVDRDLFERVSARIGATAARGRNAAAEPVSIFAGVLKCVHCGGSVVRVSKGEHVYLVCSQANARGGCKYQAVPYHDVEQAMTVNARAIFDDAPRGRDTGAIEQETATQEIRVDGLTDDVRDLVDEVVRDKSEATRRRLREKEKELDEAQANLRSLRERRDTLASDYVLRRLKAMRDSLEREPMNVPEANRALKEATSKIVLKPEAGELEIHWRHSDAVTIGPRFASRHSRTLEKIEQQEA